MPPQDPILFLEPVAAARREAAKQLQRDLEQQIEEKRRRKVKEKS